MSRFLFLHFYFVLELINECLDILPTEFTFYVHEGLASKLQSVFSLKRWYPLCELIESDVSIADFLKFGVDHEDWYLINLV